MSKKKNSKIEKVGKLAESYGEIRATQRLGPNHTDAEAFADALGYAATNILKLFSKDKKEQK